MRTLAFRLATDIVLLIAIFILPWWLWLACAALSVFVINRQYEIIPLAFLADAAYAGGQVAATAGDFGFFFLASVTVLLIIAILLRPRLNFYDKYFF